MTEAGSTIKWTIEPGTTIKWVHPDPDTDENYFFLVKAAEEVGGGQWTITLADNRKFDIWEYELYSDWLALSESQINPEGEDQAGLLR